MPFDIDSARSTLADLALAQPCQAPGPDPGAGPSAHDRQRRSGGHRSRRSGRPSRSSDTGRRSCPSPSRPGPAASGSAWLEAPWSWPDRSGPGCWRRGCPPRPSPCSSSPWAWPWRRCFPGPGAPTAAVGTGGDAEPVVLPARIEPGVDPHGAPGQQVAAGPDAGADGRYVRSRSVLGRPGVAGHRLVGWRAVPLDGRLHVPRGSARPGRRPPGPELVGQPLPGALDNASGLAALLAVAAESVRHGDVAFLVTDAEELGLVGARTALPWLPPVQGVINVDGLDDAGPFIVAEGFGWRREGSAPQLAAALLTAGAALDLPGRATPPAPWATRGPHAPRGGGDTCGHRAAGRLVVPAPRAYPRRRYARLDGRGAASGATLLTAAVRLMREDRASHLAARRAPSS
jgi:hypothetical protein